MGVFAGPNVVEDGLMLYLDAADPKSYPGSGTTWFDLSGNGRHATLRNYSAGLPVIQQTTMVILILLQMEVTQRFHMILKLQVQHSMILGTLL